MPKGDVLQDEVAEQGRLAGSRFADDVEVLTLVLGGYAKGLGIAPALAFTDCDGWFIAHMPEPAATPAIPGNPSCIRFPAMEHVGNCIGCKPAR
jgi:hypothetical protein